MFVCEFCKKKFKTEGGLSRHTCKYKERYNNFNQRAFDCWRLYMKVSRCNLGKDESKQKMRFIKDTIMFNTFNTFSNWEQEIGIPNLYDFFEYVTLNHIPFKNWQSQDLYDKYISNFIAKENPILAIERSKKFLEASNVDIHKISGNRLFLYLKYGHINKIYLQYANINPSSLLDKEQIRELGGLV